MTTLSFPKTLLMLERIEHVETTPGLHGILRNESQDCMTPEYIVELADPSWMEIVLELTDFCVEASQEQDKPAAANMRVEGWREDSASMLYVSLIEKRFSPPTGVMHFVRQHESRKVVALAGAYRSDIREDIAVLGVRAWTLKPYRSRFLLGDYLFPAQLEWAINNQFRAIFLTFNQYNEWLAQMIIRASEGKPLRFGMKTSEFYQGFHRHPKLVRVKHTPQILLYKPIDPDWVMPDLTGWEICEECLIGEDK